jgi:predicted PhzF superfamily epimerase YddE/YHI9
MPSARLGQAEAMSLELVLVDAFTDRQFGGNPAAVCLVAEFPDPALMQAVATELNLSETAFAASRGADRFDLRWFTPTTEVDLCGHATLAAAHVIGHPVRFSTRSGELTCSLCPDGRIEMDFPADPPTPTDVPRELGIGPFRWFGQGRAYHLALLEHAGEVRRLVPDLTAIATACPQGLIVTAAGDRPGVDCVSRFFAPNLGVPEDPVTGSAHCTLAPFWAARLGRPTLVGELAARYRCGWPTNGWFWAVER